MDSSGSPYPQTKADLLTRRTENFVRQSTQSSERIDDGEKPQIPEKFNKLDTWVLSSIGAEVPRQSDEKYKSYVPRYLVEKKKMYVGGMAYVHEAFDLQTMLPIVVKLGNPEAYKDISLKDKMIKEAKIMAKIGSVNPNVVRILDCLDTTNGPMIIMERMDPKEQPTLNKLLKEKGSLDSTTVISIVSGIAGAIDSMGQRGILHYDLKPSNVFFDLQSGIPKVSDFGISAKIRINNPGPPITRVDNDKKSSEYSNSEDDDDRTANDSDSEDETPGGTPGWISPERAAGSNEIKTESEIFSLGLIAYYLISGEQLFKGSEHNTTEDIQTMDTSGIVKIKITEALQKQNLSETVINNVVAVLNKSLKKIPSDRYSTATAFAQDLENAFQGKTIEAKIKAIPAAEAPFEFTPKENAFRSLISRLQNRSWRR